MSLEWVHENPPHWDADKASIVGGAAEGIFNLGEPGDGELLPGEWWRVERDGKVAGYGWMEYTWGDAEILLVVDPGQSGHGVGSFILDRLEEESAQRGLNYLYNVVREGHPQKDAVTAWLKDRRFEASHDSDRLVRQVRRQP